MNDYYSLFREYLINQKSNSVNTRDSYLRDVAFFLDYLSQNGLASPVLADEQVLDSYVEYLRGLNRSATTISRNIASVRCFYKFLIFRGELDSNPAKTVKSCRRCSAAKKSIFCWRSRA